MILEDPTRQSLDNAPDRDRLVALWDEGTASIDVPPEGRIVIGRAEDCGLRIEHGSVSRHHATLHLGTPARIEDLGSSNGTFVAGRRLEPNRPHELAPNTLVRIGDVLVVLRSAEAREEPRARSRAEAAPPPLLPELAAMAATGTLPVIILGETGAGKGVLAEAIHNASPRKARRLVRLNCAALPEALLESELFGHERGAFTGATQAKPGLLEAADGGTLLLDEVAEMPLATQAKLLHVVEHGEVLRLGSLRPRTIDVRFIAATNRDIDELVSKGLFRRDLYFRLAGLTIRIAPLRERRDEIPTLARAFLADACTRMGKPAPALSDETLALLSGHAWPGNVRELKNAMARYALLGRTDILLSEQVSADPVPAAASADPMQKMKSDMRELEKQRIVDALARCAGSQTKAALLLGISRRTLTKRLEEFDLPRPRKRVP
jgi:DNA-binding NtrC family response regulator